MPLFRRILQLFLVILYIVIHLWKSIAVILWRRKKSMLSAVDLWDTRLWYYCGFHQTVPSVILKSSSAGSSSSALMINFLHNGSYKILQDIYNYHYTNNLGKGTASRIRPLKSHLRSCINIWYWLGVCARHKTMNIYIYREPIINQDLYKL